MPDLLLERRLGGHVCGIDEVGRGPLAGPVVTACVYIPPETYGLPFWAQVTDSKQVSEKKRDALAPLIREHTVWSFGSCNVDEIDRLNILQATLMAMQRAFEALFQKFSSPLRGEDVALATGGGDKVHRSFYNTPTLTLPPQGGGNRIEITHALVDGNRAPKLPIPVMTVIKGDATCLSIAAASIIAKVERDRIMRELHDAFPMYNWAKNAGYGTAEHLAALSQYGACPHHRQSFAPVRIAKSR